MKHLAAIQIEFLKISGELATNSTWDSWSYDAQKRYLEQHPESKKKLTAKPSTDKYEKSFPNMKMHLIDEVNELKLRND